MLYKLSWEKLVGSMVTYTSSPSVFGNASDLETKEILTICWGGGTKWNWMIFICEYSFARVHVKNMEEPVHLYIFI